MTLHERDLSAMPADIGAVGQQVLDEADLYRVIGEQRADLVGDGPFAALYEPTGRAAVSPSVLALVTIGRSLEDRPDREAARAVGVRLDRKYALPLPSGYRGFDVSCLSSFRRRLVEHERSRPVSEAVPERARARGFLKRHGKQRTDALAVVGAVRVGQDGARLLDRPAADTSTNGFKLADFAIDRDARRATCPAGAVATEWAVRTERDGGRSVQIRVAAAVCPACPLRLRCTTDAGGRTLSLTEHCARRAARGAEAQTPAFRAGLRTRAGIEAARSEPVRAHGLRRHRSRGDARRPLEHLPTPRAPASHDLATQHATPRPRPACSRHPPQHDNQRKRIPAAPVRQRDRGGPLKLSGRHAGPERVCLNP